MEDRLESCVFIAVGMALLAITGCGGGGPTGTPPTTTTYTIGGAVSGLSGTGLVLQENGGNNLSVSANGAFVFTTPLASGSTYAVTVLTQPSNPAQSCAVANGSGTATADVTNVRVACTVTTPPPTQVFPLWVMPTSVSIAQESSETVAVGLNGYVGPANRDTGFTSPVTVQVSGLPGGVTVFPVPLAVTPEGGPQPLTFSVSASAAPGSATLTLTGVSSTMSASINLPFSVTPASPPTPTTPCLTSAPPPSPNPHPAPNEWTWESGSNAVNQAGIYGTQRIAAATNVPGARVYASTWTDAAGNLWLFGGYGADSTGIQGDLNDLWKYSEGEWTWVSGSNVIEQPGAYGTQGTPAPTSTPGARYQAVSWTDPSGNFWLFGGLGIDSTGTRGYLNDLWKYSGGQWTWMSGSDTLTEMHGNYVIEGVYGTPGTPAPGNTPGARVDAAAWADSCGNLWLFGGGGWDSVGNGGILNDLWKYSGGEWTWMSGSNIVGQNGTYGTLGTLAPGNVPGARTNPVTWIDNFGNLWLFGGQGNDLNGIRCEETGGPCDLNDLWEYSGGEWTWMGGSNVVQQPGTYGTQGTPAPGNIPGARDSAVSWTDAAGNFWLFGGFGFDSTTGAYTVYGDLNDLWKYSGGQWTWISGSNDAGQTGTYGTQGTPDPANVPGCRDSAVSWIDPSGNLWFFGGGDYLSIAHGGKFNDLWMYQP